MSADNGTYILQTAGPLGPEYRIAHLAAIDNIYEEYKPETDNWTPNAKAIVEAFGSSTIFTNLDEAWDAAEFVDSSKESEYGTNLITQFQEYRFSDLEEKYAKSKNKT